MTFQKNSTWRRQTITIPPNSVETVDFPETNPNYIHINNLSANVVTLGLKIIPDAQKFNMKVKGYASDVYGEEVGTKKAYIYNDGTGSALLELTSFNAPFDPNILKDSSGGSSSGGTTSNVDATIVGHSVALPAGNNKIGTVSVDTLPALPAGTNNIGDVDVLTLPPLPAGTNNIGDVDVLSLPSLPTGGNKIGSVDVGNTVTVTKANNPANHQHFQGDIGTTEVIHDMTGAAINKLNFIKNEGTTDVFVAFDATTFPATLATTNGSNGVFRLASGDVLTDLERNITKIKLIRASGSGIVRFMGV